ncbi:MAG: transposase [Kineosporiaceae bacterium]
MKERLRHLLHATTLTDLDHRRDLFTDAVTAAAIPETDRLAATITTWWPAIEVLVITSVTNARTEGRQHHHQADQAHRPRLHHQPPPLQDPYPPRQRRRTAA